MKTLKEVVCMAFIFFSILNAQTSVQVRKPAVADMFYPGNPTELTSMIKKFLSETKIVVKGEIGGLVSPHAGYVYSGPVAAWSYRQIEGKTFDVVVVVAPSHYEYFPGASVYPGDFYATPLGKIPVSKNLTQELTNLSTKIYFSEKGHRVSSLGRSEHSLEVQLPFLQYVLGDFQLIPIVMADQSWENVHELANALATLLKNKKALIVASSDLSHYHAYDTAYKMDKSLQNLFETGNFKALIEGCESRKIEACGYGPIATMMYACSLLGYKKTKVLKYATSGDVPAGNTMQVVGYMSGVAYR